MSHRLLRGAILVFTMCTVLACVPAGLIEIRQRSLPDVQVLISPTATETNTPTLPPTLTETPMPTTTLTPTATSTSTLQPPLPSSTSTDAKVLRVVDGDTIAVEIDGNAYPVRYIGIDCPEPQNSSGQPDPHADEATARNAELVAGKIVRLERDVSETDRYGRLLRYVWFGDTLINEVLVREGLAYSSAYPPDVKYQGRLDESQNQAIANAVGLWEEAVHTTRSVLQAEFVGDITVPDDTVLAPGSQFDKIWRLHNSGETAWEGCSVIHIGGDALGASGLAVNTVEPGEAFDVILSMTAPDVPGTYESHWQIKDGNAIAVGKPFYVRIIVQVASAPLPIQPLPVATPEPAPTLAPTSAPRSDCLPCYPDVCIPGGPDLDCGDIPYRRFRVVGCDPHRFDGDRDGIGCEG